MNRNFLDGRRLAEEMSLRLRKEASELSRKPKLVSVVVGDSGGSVFYQNLKKKKAEEVGIDVEIMKFEEDTELNQLIKLIGNLNTDKTVDGIMLQLPLPEKFSKDDRNRIINSIVPEKDVDGMRDDSKFISPVVQAVDLAISVSEEWNHNSRYPRRLVVVGARGFEGGKIMNYFLNQNKHNSYFPIGVYSDSENADEIIKDADILVATTGMPGLIKSEMVKEGVVLIDVGAPIGDIDKEAYEKACFVSPVPGGIGPLTIYFLLENVYESTIRSNVKI